MIATLVAITAFTLTQTSGTTDSQEAVAATPTNVVVTSPKVQQVTEWDDYTGRFEAIDQVELKARVSGHLVNIHFKDGDFVEKGQTLFTIDPRPFETQVAVVQAELAEAKIRLDLANLQLERSTKLVENGSVSRSHFDRDNAEYAQAKARLHAAESRLAQAQLDLEFTAVTAPLSGRIDRHYVDVGNVITAQETALTTIVSMDKMYVTFDVNQNAYLKYMRYDMQGTRTSSRRAPNPVRIALGDSREFTLAGTMDYVANQVNTDTGTIRARAIVDNSDYFLTPGLFARVKLLAQENVATILIPDSAIATEQADRVVFVVNDENQVESRIVELGSLVGGERIVRSGLMPGDKVITQGAQRVGIGQVVAAQWVSGEPTLITALHTR